MWRRSSVLSLASIEEGRRQRLLGAIRERPEGDVGQARRARRAYRR
jgi:hypothetical protein